MLTANADLKFRSGLTTALDTNFHQLANALFIQDDEGVVLHDLTFNVVRQKHNGVIAAQPQTRLRQIIRAKREKLGLTSDGVRRKRGSRQFHHRPYGIGDPYTQLLHDAFRRLINVALDDHQLFDITYERHHNFGKHFNTFPLQFTGRL